MSNTRAVRRLLNDFQDKTGNKIISVNEEEFLSDSVTTSSSSMRDPVTPMNTNKVKFQHQKRKSWTFLNVRLNVAMLQKNTLIIVATQKALMRLYKIFRCRQKGNVCKI